MSESATITQEAPSALAQKAIDDSSVKFAKDSDSAVKMIPLNEAEKADVTESVKAKMKELEGVDIYSGDPEAISKSFSDIFSRADANKAATAELANYFTQRNFRGKQDGASFKAVTDLAGALQKYDPSKFDLSEPEGMLGKISMLLPKNAQRGMANYMRSFKEAQGQIESLMDGVASVAEDGVKAKTELKTFDAKLLKLSKQLRVQFETFSEISKSVDEYLVDLGERDPMKAEKVKDELKYRLSEARLDTMTTLLQAMNGSILVSSLVKTQDMIITGATRAASSGRLILTINQTTAASVSEQADAANLLGTVNDVIGNLTEANAKMVKEHVKNMKELASAPLGQAEKLKSAFKMGFEALDELKDVQKEVTTRMDANITSMQEIYADASNRVKAEQQAVGTFSEVAERSAKLATERNVAEAAEATAKKAATAKI